jgi:hypothetical protein
MMRARRGDADYAVVAERLGATRDWLIALLSSPKSPPELHGPALVVGPPNEALGGEFARLRKAALTLLTAAATYRQAALA